MYASIDLWDLIRGTLFAGLKRIKTDGDAAPNDALIQHANSHGYLYDNEECLSSLVFGHTRAGPCFLFQESRLNEQRTQRLALAVAKRSTKHCIGEGRSSDDTYSELTVFSEGLDYNTALELGGRFGQRAVFQIDAETVSAVACRTGKPIRTLRRHWDDLTGPEIITYHAGNS